MSKLLYVEDAEYDLIINAVNFLLEHGTVTPEDQQIGAELLAHYGLMYGTTVRDDFVYYNISEEQKDEDLYN